MRISDILNGLTAIQINEAEAPRNKAEQNSNLKKGAEASAEKEQKPKGEKPTSMADPGANQAAKGKYQKPDTQSKSAGSTDKSQQQPGPETELVKGGKGVGNAGGQVKRAANQDVKSGRAGEKEAQRVASDKKKGTLDPLRTYGQGTDATGAADQWADEVGTEEYDDHGQSFGSSPTFGNDAKDNQAFGLDDPDALNNAETADMQDAWDEKENKKPGDQLPPHDPDQVKIQLASDDTFQREIGKAMERANEEWFEAQAAAKEAESRMSKDRGAKKPRDQHSPEVADRLKKKAKLAQKNKDAFDSLSREQKAQGNATGAKRGSLEVTQNLADVNKAGEKLDKDGINQAAAAAAEGDQEAQAALFKNMGRMLFGLARKYSFGNQDKLADLYGESKAALMQAIKTYDPEQGAQFSTWLYKNVDSLVKNAAYGDRNIGVEQRQLDKVAKYNKLKADLQNQGIQGVDADLEIIDKMGLKSWADLDKIKQTAAMSSTSSLDAPVSMGDDEEGNVSDVIGGGQGVQSDYTASETPNIGSGAGADEELENISKELAMGDDETKSKIFSDLADEAELDDEERKVIEAGFGIGGEALVNHSEIQMATGITRNVQNKVVPNALKKMALVLADNTGSSADEEFQNLQKLWKDREFDKGAAGEGRTVGDYADDSESPEEVKSRTDRKANREKRRAKQAASKEKDQAKRDAADQKAMDKEYADAPKNVAKAQKGVEKTKKLRAKANKDAIKRNKAEAKAKK